MQHSRHRRTRSVFLLAGLLATATTVDIDARRQGTALTGTRLAGVRVGPYSVGFALRTGLDETRRINILDAGTRIGVATWYPAQDAGDRPRMTSLDYRLLELGRVPTDAEKTRYADAEADAAVGWRHVGIVPLSKAQARASLASGGIAVRDATRVPGTFPLVMILGGQYYLASTAEALASHGFFVAAPFRFSDQSNEIGTSDFTWYLENSVRDAEWALNDLRGSASGADVTRLGALGHGGGGMQALLFAMRQRGVSALVNIDAGNFSSRTNARAIPFYSPRLLRAPYLYVATPETRKGQDRFDDFLAMTFSDRIEAVLDEPTVRHHDLSDLGRAVTAPLGIRGEAQEPVQHAYAAVQDLVVRFLDDHLRKLTPGGGAPTEWAAGERTDGFRITARAGSAPAPTPAAVIASLGAETASSLRAAWRRDPEAAVFQPEALARIIGRALDTRRYDAAEAISEVAVEIRAESAILHELRSDALEARGALGKAAEAAAACAGTPGANDWRTEAAAARCRIRLERLRVPR